jgi:hypothetical protein
MAIRRAAKPARVTKKRASAAKPKRAARPRTFWDDLADIGRSIPSKDLALLPSAANFDEEHDRLLLESMRR